MLVLFIKENYYSYTKYYTLIFFIGLRENKF